MDGRGKKIIFIFIFSILIPVTMVAQSFTSLWQKVEQAGKKDLPKTQIDILSDIAEKANAQNSYGDLLKAEVMTAQLKTEISRDSLMPQLKRLAVKAAKAEKSNPVLAAVYNAVIGKIIKESGLESNNYDDEDIVVMEVSDANDYDITDISESSDNSQLSDEKDSNSETFPLSSKVWFLKALKNPEALARTYSTEYNPLVIEGKDDKSFLGDLLHVIGIEAQDYEAMHKYYETHGNRASACICAFERLKEIKEKEDDNSTNSYIAKKSKYLQNVDSLLNVYGDLPEAGELAIEHYNCLSQAEDVKPEEQINYINYALTRWGGWPHMNVLRNAKSYLTLPSFQVMIDSEVVLPQKKHQVTITSALNIGELTMSVFRIKDDKIGFKDEGLNNKSDNLESMISDPMTFTKKVKKLLETEPVYQQTKRYIGLPEYKQIRDTMDIAPLDKGLYVVEFTTDNNLIKPERALLRVSNMKMIRLTLPNNCERLVVVNSTTGEPIPHAKIAIECRKSNAEGEDFDAKNIKTLVCDEKGEYVYNRMKNVLEKVKAYTEDDKYNLWTRFYVGSYPYYYYNEKNTETICKLFTDRSIYRPGQIVHAALISYKEVHHKSTFAEKGKNLELTLRNPNGKIVGKKSVTTDEFGSGSTDFVLPANGLTGNYWLRADASGRYYGGASFSVEEYKRPTFNINFDKIKSRYTDGDTLKVRGEAKSFAGVPVQNARVSYTVKRRPAIFWGWRNNKDGVVKMATDTIVTDDKGQFFIPVDLIMPEGYDAKIARYYSFDIEAQVTNASGESHNASISIPLSNRSTMFSVTMPDKIERGTTTNITFNYTNIARENIDGDVNVSVLKDNEDGKNSENISSFAVKTNTSTDFKTSELASGGYTLHAVTGKDTLSQKFIVFSLDDTKPVMKTKDWYYQKGEKFALDGTPVYIQIGSSEKQHIVYSILSGKTMLESGTIDLNDEVQTRKFDYKSSYGDGICVNYAWVKDGEMYQHTAKIERELPDKNLNVVWKTFRDRLTPGQKEQWTLNITTPEGKPAKAQLLSVLYDKSLDEIRQHNWKLVLNLYMNVPNSYWSTYDFKDISLYGEMKFTALPELNLDFAHFDESLFNLGFNSYDRVMIGGLGSTRGRMLMAKAPASMEMLSENEVVASDNSTIKKGNKVFASYGDVSSSTEEQVKKSEEVKPRENFNETAFFYPALVTDGKGDINIKFTLPESVTTWRFMGLVHDSLMNNGMLTGETIAKKTVMIQPNMPRFLRSGDKATISAMLSNTSVKNVDGKAKIEIIDPETEKTIYSQSTKFTLEAGKTSAVAFYVDASTLPTLSIIKFTAQGKGFSDGEQHYLPVLPDKELVTNTLPFSLNEKGTKTFDVSRLFAVKNDGNKLTVEYTGNPVWLMVQALPSISETQNDNAISLAAAFYANSLGRYIMNAQPNIKQMIERWLQEKGTDTSLQSQLEKNQELKDILIDETPWIRDAEKETEQKKMLINFFDESSMDYRISTQLAKLKKLQKSDGGFTWWPGMPSSPFITNAVTETLVRLKAMTGNAQNYDNMITSAYSFLDKVINKEVKDMKEYDKKDKTKDMHPSEFATQYLYICALNGRKLNGTAANNQQYLINKLKSHGSEMTIYGKATAAVIFAKHPLSGTDGKKLANDYIQSIKEYTVCTDEMGRYFDTWKAYYSWCDYRIPSQVAAIEALQNVSPDDVQTVEEMQRWLLQEKRTTSWSTPINSVNAIYAFMNGGKRTLAQATDKSVKVKVNGKELGLPQTTAGLGYFKTSRTGSDFKTLTIDKYNDGISWGAAYGQSLQKITDIKGASSGIKINREMLKDGKPVAELHVGDRVKVRITINADRDYDFVQVADKRAACMEPLQQLSGYHWGYYCSPKDNATYYYFDRLAKGKHVIETEYYIDRKGSYDTGTCTAQCAYSPEYSARSTAKNIEVK